MDVAGAGAGGGALLPLAGAKSTHVSSGSEPFILADRLGRFLWIGDTSGVHRSGDNGTTWSDMPLPATTLSLLFTDGVALAQDEKGRLYAASLSDNRGDVSRSDDGTAFASSSFAAGLPVDRPWVAAHGDTAMLVFLNNYGVLGSLEGCARSTDAGRTFLDRNPASGPSGSGGIAADDQGTFYVTYSGTGSLTRLRTCTDAVWPATDSQEMFDALGANNMVAVASNGSALHVAAADAGNAIVLSSVRAWGDAPRRLRLSPPELQANTFAAVAARGRDVAVAWYGSATGGDPSGTGFGGSFDVYVARVHDPFGEAGGPSVRVEKVTATPNHRGQICMGGLTCTGNRGLLDYFGVAIDLWGGVHVAYVDDTSSAATYHVHLPPWDAPPATLDNSSAPASSSASLSASSSSAAPKPNPSQPVLAAHFHASADGLLVTTDGRASTGKAPLTYRWAWGDGRSGSGVAASHAYPANGSYDLRLRVTDADGRSAESGATLRLAAAASGSAADGAAPGGVTVQVPGPAPPAAAAALALAGWAAARRPRRP
jgi:hypothetical protein